MVLTLLTPGPPFVQVNSRGPSYHLKVTPMFYNMIKKKVNLKRTRGLFLHISLQQTFGGSQA